LNSRNGDRYCGEYFGDKIHGFGIYNFANGHCYEGSWHEGKKQGFGMYTFRNGDVRSGEWDCGSLKNPQSPNDPVVQRAVLVYVYFNLILFKLSMLCSGNWYYLAGIDELDSSVGADIVSPEFQVHIKQMLEIIIAVTLSSNYL
jgi:MORN repeat